MLTFMFLVKHAAAIILYRLCDLADAAGSARAGRRGQLVLKAVDVLPKRIRPPGSATSGLLR